MRMPTWVWPDTRCEASSTIQRLGRVLYWITAGAGLVLIMLAPIVFVRAAFGLEGADVGGGIGFVIIGILLFVTGRSVRYVLAGE